MQLDLDSWVQKKMSTVKITLRSMGEMGHNMCEIILLVLFYWHDDIVVSGLGGSFRDRSGSVQRGSRHKVEVHSHHEDTSSRS